MTTERISRVVIFTALSFEVAFILFIGSFIIRGYFSGGQLPAPYNPDPANFGLHHTISLFCMMLAPWILLIGVIFSVLAAIRKQIAYPWLTIMRILSVSIIIWLAVDPFRFSEWILD